MLFYSNISAYHTNFAHLTDLLGCTGTGVQRFKLCVAESAFFSEMQICSINDCGVQSGGAKETRDNWKEDRWKCKKFRIKSSFIIVIFRYDQLIAKLTGENLNLY